MRVSRQQARKNREQVLETAGRLLRERGFEGTSLADIMGQAGLTHGGFYRQFASKTDLATQAVQHAAASMRSNIMVHLTGSSDEPLPTLIKQYVSSNHRENAGSGCILPTLASEAARRDDPNLRSVFAAVIQDYLEQVENWFSTKAGGTCFRPPEAIVSEMVGAIILSRVLPDEDSASSFLDAVVDDLLAIVS
jgi:TetR/AcrR family transcriptional repressor of nem operon